VSATIRGITIVLATALCSTPAAAQLRHGVIVLPVGSCISSPFGPRVLSNHPQAGTYHNGVDLPAPEGTPVRAVASGRLLRIQHSGPGGLEVLIQHNGFVAVYSHLAMVAPELGKSVVTAGEIVGVVGRTGVSFGAHLFFAVLQAGRAVDPAPLLGAPFCNGVAHQQTPAEILAAGGKLPPTRHYYLLSDFPTNRR
jgi:murein DD-endopeptidase MepM/ murein hydrolase activator NlpD